VVLVQVRLVLILRRSPYPLMHRWALRAVVQFGIAWVCVCIGVESVRVTMCE